MQIGATTRLLSAVAAFFLFITGSQEWSAQSSGADSWAGETSFAALDLRAHGKLKIGLGIGFLALSAAGVGRAEKKQEEDQSS